MLRQYYSILQLKQPTAVASLSSEFVTHANDVGVLSYVPLLLTDSTDV